MNSARVKCYFEDSEEFMARLVIVVGLKLKIRKIIDPYKMVTSSDIMKSEDEYEVSGKSEELAKLKEFVSKSDYDVEVYIKGDR